MSGVNMTTVVLYHAVCYDGFGSAWVAHKALGDNATYIAVQHGEPVPDLPSGARIYIIDFAYDRKTIQGLIDAGHELTILDHHQTAQAALEGLSCAEFDMNRSGAMMAWDHFFPGEEPPVLIKWIQDRDLWRWEIPGSKAASAALRAYEFDFDIWDKLAANPDELLAGGKVALALTDQTVDMICKQAQIGNLGDYEIPIVNATCHWSEVGNQLCHLYPDHPFSASYHFLANGESKWSLRSVGEFDVSEVAKRFGGGGHKNAAGFNLPANYHPLLMRAATVAADTTPAVSSSGN